MNQRQTSPPPKKKTAQVGTFTSAQFMCQAHAYERELQQRQGDRAGTLRRFKRVKQREAGCWGPVALVAGTVSRDSDSCLLSLFEMCV